MKFEILRPVVKDWNTAPPIIRYSPTTGQSGVAAKVTSWFTKRKYLLCGPLQKKFAGSLVYSYKFQRVFGSVI